MQQNCSTLQYAMIDAQQVFVADAKPMLALPIQRTALVWGAASTMGEALLNQCLASPHYTRVYVCTTAALPGSVAHLQGFSSLESIAWQSLLGDIDFILIACDTADSVPLGQRNRVYSPLNSTEMPALLRQLAALPSNSLPSNTATMRYLGASLEIPTTQLADYFAVLSAHSACMVFGLEQGAVAHRKQAYRFKAQADTLLDRLGVKVLNTLSGIMHGMLSPQTTAPLTVTKKAQRLAQRFEALPAQGGAVVALSANDLIA